MQIAGSSDSKLKELEERALLIRRLSIAMMAHAKIGHVGGSLSEADLLAALYFHFLRLDPANPQWEDRDRFVLSKGHACAAHYVALALRGFFPVAELCTFGSLDARLQGHPGPKVPGVEIPTGSLGQGLSVAVGMAWAGRYLAKDYRVWALLGDGESNSGQIWEAAMAAGHHRLGNLTAILDYNKVQAKGRCAEVMNIEPIVDKWRAFNWRVWQIDGHNMREIVAGLETARSYTDGPGMVIAHTVKGKGVSFMEDTCAWHTGAPSPEDAARALAELGIEDAAAFEREMCGGGADR